MNPDRNTMSVRTQFDFDPSEHYQVTRAVTRATGLRWMVWIVCGVFAVAAAWVVIASWGERSPEAIVVSLLPYVLICVFWIFIFSQMQRNAGKNLMKTDPSVLGPQERTIDAVGYHSRGNGVGLDVPWHAMLRASETDAFFLFFYTKLCVYYLPKRVLSPEQIREVRGLTRAALGDRAQLVQD